MELFGPFSWVLIPLAAILMGTLMGGFSEWLKFKAAQQKLGTSTLELENQVVQLERDLQAARADRDALARRLENIETIVTSQTWDALHEPNAGRQVGASQAQITLPDLDAGPSDADRVAHMARRVR
ncbi:MAG: hypothetical protein AAGJ10_19000 [Bacteroidota bacterium]